MLTLLFGAAAYLFLLGQLSYFGYFNSIPNLAILKAFYTLGEIKSQLVTQIFGAQQALLLALLAGSLLATVGLKWKMPSPPARAKRVFAFIFLLFAAKIGWAAAFTDIRHYYFVDSVDTLRAHGYAPVYLVQLWDTLVGKTQGRVAFPGKLNGPASAPRNSAGTPRPYNVIFIQVESLDKGVIDFKAGNEEVAPFLDRLADSCLFFPHIFAEHLGGSSSDAEVSTLTGLIPLKGQPSYLSMKYAEVFSLPRFLDSLGYHSAAFHSFTGRFFHRATAFRGLGFRDFFDEEAYTGAARGWRSKDSAFLLQTSARLEGLPRPFFAYLITLQSHGPYGNHGPSALAFDPAMPAILKDYLASVHEVDRALAAFFSRLASAGLLDSTVVFMYGDHWCGVPIPCQAGQRYCLSGMQENIPLFIKVPGKAARAIPKVGTDIDFVPTLLDVLGRTDEKRLMGTSLLAPGEGLALMNQDPPKLIRLDPALGRPVAGALPNSFYRFVEYSNSLLK